MKQLWISHSLIPKIKRMRSVSQVLMRSGGNQYLFNQQAKRFLWGIFPLINRKLKTIILHLKIKVVKNNQSLTVLPTDSHRIHKLILIRIIKRQSFLKIRLIVNSLSLCLQANRNLFILFHTIKAVLHRLRSLWLAS